MSSVILYNPGAMGAPILSASEPEGPPAAGRHRPRPVSVGLSGRYAAQDWRWWLATGLASSMSYGASTAT